MKPSQKKYINLRIIIVGIVFIIFFSIIGTRAIYLQVFCYSDLSQKATNEYIKVVTTLGKRGTIYDRNGGELAVSIDIRSIAAYPPHIRNTTEVAKTLARELNIEERPLRQKLESGRSFVWVKRQVPPREAEAVRKLGFSGIDFIPEHQRFYTNRILASQVIGFTGIDGRGLEGIEFYYNRYLQGKAGKSAVLKDALGRIFDRTGGEAEANEIREEKKLNENLSMAQSRDAKNYSGNNLILTIDRTVQFIAESALKEAVTDFSAKSGMAIVMVPETGAVLALAHVPLFNPNSFASFDREVWRNKAITDPFEPGSTMKVFSASAAMEYGGCKPDTIFFCENGAYQVGDDIIHDSHPYGWLSLEKIVKYSSNIGFVKIGETIGSESLYKTLLDFGFGKKTGIDCPGETGGSLSHYNRWSEIDAGAIAFGQAISVSAIQLITAVSAIANDGVLMKPYIVQAITDQTGVPINTFVPQKVRRAISAETARTVKKMMKSVVETGGTGVNAAMKGYSVCGKTGTAQKVHRKRKYADGRYIASFFGFVPAEKPEIAILVVVDEPQKDHYGGTVAAPVFRKIARKTLNHMNVPPRNKSDNLSASLVIGGLGNNK